MAEQKRNFVKGSLIGIGIIAVTVLAVLRLSSRPLDRPREKGPGKQLDEAVNPITSPESGHSPNGLASAVSLLARPEGGSPATLDALVLLHKALLDQQSRRETLSCLRAAYPNLPALGRVLIAFLVGGFADSEIAEFRASLLADSDARVLAFVGRVHLMAEVDETPPAIWDAEGRLRTRLSGEAVIGFNAKEYGWFWECVFYEIATELPRSFSDPKFVEAFELRYKSTGVARLSPILALYNDCFETQLRLPDVRQSLGRSIQTLQPSEEKSMIFQLLHYRPDGRTPPDMAEYSRKIVLDPTESDLDRYACVRSLREERGSELAELFRTALVVEVSRSRPNVSIAREIITGLIAKSPDELAQNTTSYRVVLKLVSDVAANEDSQGELTWIVPVIVKSGRDSMRQDLDDLALSLEQRYPSGAKKLRELLAQERD